jgi:hypothetical protein
LRGNDANVQKILVGRGGGQRKVHWLTWEKLLKPKSMGETGFRDMCLFNQALLARQAWRLIQFPESMCAQLLKAKYYPRGELIDTMFPADVSASWRGVMHGLDLLKKGIIWRVNTGTKKQIWRDPWIPRPSSFKLSLKKGRSRFQWVSQLMRTDRREWDEVLVRPCLHPHDTDEVLKICLSKRGLDDYIAWHFSVRIPYKLVLKIDQAETRLGGRNSMSDGSRPMYNKIWMAKVPLKV